MPTRTITSEAEFAGLGSLWRELYASNPTLSPYQSWEWNLSWWRAFGRCGDLRLILVEHAGRAIGLAPLYLARRYRGLPLRHLRFLSTKRADYLDFIVRPGSEACFFAELCAHLRRQPRDWHFLWLRDLPPRSLSTAHLAQATGSWPLRQRTGESCAAVALPASWDEFFGGLSRNFRKSIASDRRALGKEFQTELRIASTPEAAHAALEDLIAMYQARWRPQLGSTQFDDPRTAEFERAVCQALASTGEYRIYLLLLNGKPAAGMLVYVRNGRAYAEVCANDPAVRKYGVVTILLAMTIEHSIQAGFVEFDLMRGGEAYKQRWNGVARHNDELKCYARSVVAWIVEGWDRLVLHRFGQRLLRLTATRWRPGHRVPGQSQPAS